MGYDYVALGHDHRLHKVSNKSWYAGCPERWRFDETVHEKGFLVVDIEAGKDPVVTPHYMEFKRPVYNENLTIDDDETQESLVSKVQTWFAEKDLKTNWNPETAARVRMVFDGTSKMASSFELTMALEGLRLQALSTDSEFNVAQFVWNIRQLTDKDRTSGDYPEIDSEFLIEDPSQDFTDYLATLDLDKKLDPDLLTRIAVRALEHAVGSKDGKMNSESMKEEDK
jgi:DNA repair exonuclease SbcCD nuclease subunit